MQPMPTPGYQLVDGVDGGIPGGIGLARDGGDGRVTFFVEVDDVRESLSDTADLGGTMVRRPQEVPTSAGTFTFALMADPEGHVVGLATGLRRALEKAWHADNASAPVVQFEI